MVERAALATFATRLRDGLVRRLGIDPRALAALRIGLGSLLCVDLLLRARSLRAFYTDAGAVPRSLVLEQYPSVLEVAPHFYSGELWAVAALFAVAGAFAFAIVLGYRTRLATVGSLVLVLSLHARNPWVLTGGDTLIRHLLFWACFLPLGTRWSVDAARRGRGRRIRTEPVVGLATVGILLQVVVVYVVNVVEKLRADAWLAGDALPTILGLDRFTIMLGHWLRGVPELLPVLGWGWLATLLAAPLLIALTGRGRALVVGAFASAHLGMALTMDLQLFPFVSITALLVFLPPAVWDRVEAAVSALRERAGDQVEGVPGLPIGGSRPARGGPTPSTDDHRSILRRPIPSPPALGRVARGLRGGVLAIAIAVVLVTNAVGLGLVPGPALDTGDGELEITDTRWSMFANPPTTDRWWAAPAERASGGTVDAYREGPLRWNWPPDVTATHPTTRWRKFTSNVRWEGSLRAPLAGYLCDRWNDRHDDPVTSVDLYAVERPAGADGPDAATEHRLASVDCAAGR